MIAAFQEDWDIRFARSPRKALALLRKAPTALVCDWDSHADVWRALCSACVQRGISFHMLATMPSDDLFLSVAGAGAAGVLWKPFGAEQIIAAMDSARSLAGAAAIDADAADRAAGIQFRSRR
jgi:DNA-binding NarL/FixJ family response regulator